MNNKTNEAKITPAAGGQNELLVMATPREKAVRLIEQQLDWNTEASKKCPLPHYGACELRELLDFIYGGEPATDSEKLDITGKGWH